MSSSSTRPLGEPVNLVKWNREQGFFVDHEAKNRLLSVLCPGKPVHTIGICGKYRTGKSYFMNLLANQKQGFELGTQVVGKTRGLWFWAFTDGERQYLLIDTEGLYDIQHQSTEFSIQLLCITLLCSSFLILNLSGTLDRNSFDQLNFVGQLGQHIVQKDASDWTQIVPKMMFLIRDFFLDKIDDDGAEMTDDEYLKFALTPCTKFMPSSSVREQNAVKQDLKQFFPHRKCFTLPIPTNHGNLNLVNQLSNEKLDPVFLEKVHQAKDYVYSHVEPFELRGKALSSETLLTFLETCCDSMNNTGKLNLEHSWESVKEDANTKLIAKLKQNYEKHMREILEMPVEFEALMAIHEGVFNDVLAKFSDQVVENIVDENDKVWTTKFNNAIAQWKDKQVVGGSLLQFIKDNDRLSTEKSEKFLQDLWAEISRLKQEGVFNSGEGLKQYQSLRDQAVAKFTSAQGLGPCSSAVLERFLRSKEEEYAELMRFAEEMDKKEKKLAEEKKKAEEERSKAEKWKQDQAKFEELQRQQMESFQANISAMERRHNDQIERTEQRHQDMLHNLNEQWKDSAEKDKAYFASMMETMKESHRQQMQLMENNAQLAREQANSSGCFGLNNYVIQPDGCCKKIKHVQVGDSVLAVDSDNNLMETNVIFKAHSHHLAPHICEQEEEKIEHLCISAGGKAIILTGNHLLPVAKGHQAFASIPAGQVQVGDRVLVAPEYGISVAPLQHVEVEKIERIKDIPMVLITESGTVVVGGVVADCFTTAEMFERPAAAVMKQVYAWLGPKSELYKVASAVGVRVFEATSFGVSTLMEW